MLAPGRVVVDPARVAAQVVSGIGFVGAGVVFVRRDAVRGLTTAGAIWLTAAIGMASGAELPVLALATTLGHFAVVFGHTELARHLPGSRDVPRFIRLTYQGGQGALRSAMSRCTNLGWTLTDVGIEVGDSRFEGDHPTVTVSLQVLGKGSVAELLGELEKLPGILQVASHQVTE